MRVKVRFQAPMKQHGVSFMVDYAKAMGIDVSKSIYINGLVEDEAGLAASFQAIVEGSKALIWEVVPYDDVTEEEYARLFRAVEEWLSSRYGVRDIGTPGFDADLEMVMDYQSVLARLGYNALEPPDRRLPPVMVKRVGEDVYAGERRTVYV